MQSFLLFSMLVLMAAPGFGQESSFGRYTGYLRHAKTETDQLAKLDFVLSREEGNSLRLKAILTLHFGDYGTTDYISHHFDNVSYNVVTGDLVFDQVGQDLTLITETFGDGQLVAKVRSVTAGVVGTLIMNNSGRAVQTERSLMEPLHGEYRGVCDGDETHLQINTFRVTKDISRLGNPFATFGVVGRLGQRSNTLCPSPWGRFCVKNVIYSATYNFFAGGLQLFGRQGNVSCTVKDGDLDCDGCTLRRSSQAFSRPLQLTPRISSSRLAEVPSRGGLNETPQGVAGEYRGYLHHEFLDQYQAAWLNLVTYQDPEDGGSFKISGAARINFDTEILPYQFDQTTYRLLSPVIVLSETEENVDAMLQITQLGNGTVKGIWYSILFGRVGEFVLAKDREIELPGGARLMGGVRGEFQNEDWKISLGTRLAESFSNTTNPFHPIIFGGYFYYRAGFAPRIDFIGGSYDFYTGKIGVITENEARVATGTYDLSNGELRLHWPSKSFGTFMSLWEPRIIEPVRE